MNDETAVNKAIQEGSKWLGNNWRKWIPWAVTAIACIANGLYTYLVNIGHKQADGASLVNTVAALSIKLDRVESKVDAVSTTQAEMRGEMKGMSQSVSEVTQWKDDMLYDLREGAKTHVPKFTGHRTHH